MRDLMLICYLATSIFIASVSFTVLASVGEPSSGWLVCEVLGWRICPDGADGD